MRVLIVEDHPPMRQLIRAMVADLAESVTECADGAEAVAAYAAQQFKREDWVLMDLEMPGLDGLEATRRLCATFPGAQILIVTQFGDAHLRAAAAAGARGYVLKGNLMEVRQWLLNSNCASGPPTTEEQDQAATRHDTA
jgi:CheY-like chemotaxis protein